MLFVHCRSYSAAVQVHFIFRHKNPKTGEYEEKHLKNAPGIKDNAKTNLYTLVIHPDNTFEMYINDEEVKKGSLLEDFDPPVNPPKEIDDPSDSKPADWVDEEKYANDA
jgi:calnexin